MELLTPKPFCYCGVRENQGSGTFARWDNTRWNGRTWVGDPEPLRLTIHGPDELRACLLWAYDQWAQVAALEFEWESNPRKANLLYTVGAIDGPSGTLAWNELPFGPDKQLSGKVDHGEHWHTDPSSAPPRGRIHLGAVLAHEGGHGLGLEHDSAGNVTALMDPAYNPRVLTPQPADIHQIQLRYGGPIGGPSPDSGDPPSGQSVLMIPDGLAPGTYGLTRLR